MIKLITRHNHISTTSVIRFSDLAVMPPSSWVTLLKHISRDELRVALANLSKAGRRRFNENISELLMSAPSSGTTFVGSADSRQAQDVVLNKVIELVGNLVIPNPWVEFSGSVQRSDQAKRKLPRSLPPSYKTSAASPGVQEAQGDITISEIWDYVLRELCTTTVLSQVNAWLRPLRPLGLIQEDDFQLLELLAPNEFSAKWVKDHYVREIEEILFKHLKIRTKITIHAEGGSKARAHPGRSSTGIDPTKTFESFVMGPSNQLAFNAALTVAMEPALKYNPLSLSGAPGLGKTHLLHAIKNKLVKAKPELRVVYATAESLCSELIESIGMNQMKEFRSKYREDCDVLLVDDIGFIAGKVRTEEEFLHLFNTLHSAKKQIVLSSDQPISEMTTLDARLKDRLTWGLLAPIKRPELVTRTEILKRIVINDCIDISDDAILLLAKNSHGSVRELTSALINLTAQANLKGGKLDRVPIQKYQSRRETKAGEL